MTTNDIAYGLDERQLDFLFALLAQALDGFDPRPQHFVLMVLTREDFADDEDDEDDGKDLVSTNVVSSLDMDSIQNAMRDWLNRKTQ